MHPKSLGVNLFGKGHLDLQSNLCQSVLYPAQGNPRNWEKGEGFMTKRLLICSLALVLVAGFSFAKPSDNKDGSWTGWVTDSMCGAKGASAKHADCAKKCVDGGHGKYALYNPADKKVYSLDPQEKLAEHAGHFVKVTGTVEGETIKVKSVEMAPEPKPAAEK